MNFVSVHDRARIPIVGVLESTWARACMSAANKGRGALVGYCEVYGHCYCGECTVLSVSRTWASRLPAEMQELPEASIGRLSR